MKDYDEYVTISKIYSHIIESTKQLVKKSTKRSLIDKTSKTLLGLEFTSNYSIKPKC